ncbi:MAG: glycosyltransferase family 2 protein [Brevirhabdus sp.]
MTRAEPKDAFAQGEGAKGDQEEQAGVVEAEANTENEDLDDTPVSEFPLWFDELSPGGQGEGFFEKGGKHSLMFVRRPVKRLLVTFDNLANVNDSTTHRVPWAYKFARDNNVSHLGVFAHVADWYRDEGLINRFRKLADEGFFDGYDRVLFAGTSMGAFGALAFGSLVPGAHVAAFNPQSTLDTELVPWETRYWSGRRQDWTLPLSDTAKLTAKMGQVSIFYDPYFELDLKHFQRYSGDNIREFKCWFSNHKSAVFLRRVGGLKPVMYAALFSELTQRDFYQIYRGRRDLRWYKGALCAYFDKDGREKYSHRATLAFRKNFRARQAEGALGKQVETPALMREPVKNDKRVIVTTMKNEAPFMLEWVAYNRAIGFTDLMIYTNDCDDGTDKIAMRLEELGLAIHQDNRFKKGASPQRVALRRGFNHDATKDADWLICADVDEYLNIRVGDGTLDDLFEATGDADAISLCWKLFGNGGLRSYKDKFVTEQFFWAAPEDYRGKYRALGLKTLVRRNDKLLRMSVHRPKFVEEKFSDIIWKDAGGQRMPKGYFTQGWSAHKAFSSEFARLHHYAVRSVDSFLVKRDRGRTNHIDRDQGVLYWADMNLNMAEDRSILPRLPGAKKIFDELMADDELKRLHDEAVANHKSKIAALKKREGWPEFREKIIQINKVGQDPTDPSFFAGNEPKDKG